MTPKTGRYLCFCRITNSSIFILCIFLFSDNNVSDGTIQTLKLHEDVGLFDCEVCHNTINFVFSELLKEHLVTHADVKTHICPICGKGF